MTRRTLALSVIRIVLGAVALSTALAAQRPRLDDLVDRLSGYAVAYGPQLAAIVAEEHYTQLVESDPGTVVVPAIGPSRRVIRSDFVLTQLDDDTWVAFRDAFEVDGTAVRDREDRLVELLSRGGTAAWRQAAAIANESARFNIGSGLITRNINVPTFVMQLLQPVHRSRFRFSLAKPPAGGDRTPDREGAGGSARADDPGRALIEFRERERPTLVRQRNGSDQPLRGTIALDAATGAVRETRLTWERGPGGFIHVTFDRRPDVDLLVPVRMLEEYRDERRLTIRGDAIYSNFRRFDTAARVLPR